MYSTPTGCYGRCVRSVRGERVDALCSGVSHLTPNMNITDVNMKLNLRRGEGRSGERSEERRAK